MQHKTLPGAEAGIAVVGFGAWAIGADDRDGSYGPVARADALEALCGYVEGGGNFIDTATRYGRSEEVIGEFMAGEGLAQTLVIASKSPHTDAAGIRADVEESLRRLRRDWVDLYYLHSPPEDPDEMNRALDAYEVLMAEGKVRAVGASIKGPDVTDETVRLCRQYIRTGRVHALQVIYSILRQKNRDVFAQAAEAGVAIIARTVLESGFLTGKYKPGDSFAGRDHRTRWAGQTLQHLLTEAQDVSRRLAERRKETPAQLAMRFALDEPAVTSIIPGAKNRKQAVENLQAERIAPLSPEMHDELVRRYADRCEQFNTGR